MSIKGISGLGRGCAARRLPFSQRHSDPFNYTVDVFHHFAIPKAQDSEPSPFEPLCPAGVFFCLFRMLPAIDFDRELFGKTGEVDDIIAKRHLATKPESIELLPAQTRPKFSFRVGLITAQFAGER